MRRREVLALARSRSAWHRSRRNLAKRRDKRAAKRLLVALMKCYGFVPKRIITDKLRSYGAAKVRLHALGYPQLLFSSIPSPCRANNSLPPPRSVRHMEHCGLYCMNISKRPDLLSLANLT